VNFTAPLSFDKNSLAAFLPPIPNSYSCQSTCNVFGFFVNVDANGICQPLPPLPSPAPLSFNSFPSPPPLICVPCLAPGIIAILLIFVFSCSNRVLQVFLNTCNLFFNSIFSATIIAVSDLPLPYLLLYYHQQLHFFLQHCHCHRHCHHYRT